MRSLPLVVLVFLIQTVYVSTQPRFSLPTIGRPGAGTGTGDGGSSMPSFSPPSLPDRDRPSISESDSPTPSSSQSISISIAQADHSPPVRGRSPMPYMPVDFVDPFNNPTNRIPEQPRASCGMNEVACQAYRRCYPCYADHSLSICQTCLNLIRARTADDQLKEICNLCKADPLAITICSMAEPYCPL